MIIQSRSHSVFTLFSFITTSFIVFAYICSAYKSPDSLMNKYYTGSSISSGDRSSTIGKSKSGLCNIKRHVIEVQHEGADERVRIPILHLDTNPSLADRYYSPINERLKSKKSQRAILLDVGDYIVKSDGEVQVVADDVPRASPGVGGILRNSG